MHNAPLWCQAATKALMWLLMPQPSIPRAILIWRDYSSFPDFPPQISSLKSFFLHSVAQQRAFSSAGSTLNQTLSQMLKWDTLHGIFSMTMSTGEKMHESMMMYVRRDLSKTISRIDLIHSVWRMAGTPLLSTFACWKKRWSSHQKKQLQKWRSQAFITTHSLTSSLSYPIHSCFSSKVLDTRSYQIWSTDLYWIRYDKLLHSYPVHIMLNTAYFLHLVYLPFRYIDYAYFWLCTLIC